MSQNRLLLALGLVVLAALVLSGLGPYDRGTSWLMEVAPVLMVAPVLVLTRCHFPLTTLLYILAWLAIIPNRL